MNKHAGGRPKGVTMLCGWGCQARLSATEMRGHFKICPQRPQAGDGSEIKDTPQVKRVRDAQSEDRPEVVGVKKALARLGTLSAEPESTTASQPLRSNVMSSLGELKAATPESGLPAIKFGVSLGVYDPNTSERKGVAVEVPNVPTYNPEPPRGADGLSDRMTGLRSLLHKAEVRVGMKGPKGQTPKEAVERARCAALVGVDAEVAEPSPYQKSESRRTWSERMAKLKQLGMYDDAGASEGFSELIRGHHLPNGFMRWTDARKLDWLVENVEVPE